MKEFVDIRENARILKYFEWVFHINPLLFQPLLFVYAFTTLYLNFRTFPSVYT